jgi:hypothetical protein
LVTNIFRGEANMMTRRAASTAILATICVGAAPNAQNASPDAVIASAQYAGDPDLRCDLLEVKRVSGGAVLIRWRLVNTAGQATGLTATATKPISYDFDWPQLYFIDPAENKKYQFLTDSAGNRILDVWYGDLAPGGQRLSWAKFPAPPASSTKISVTIPKFAPFEDVPVSE